VQNAIDYATKNQKGLTGQLTTCAAGVVVTGAWAASAPERSGMTKRRVVVTNSCSPCRKHGIESWANLLAGKSGIRHHRVRCKRFACKFAGEVKGFDITQYIPEKEARHMDRFIHLGSGRRHPGGAGQRTADRRSAVDELATRIGVQHRLGHRRAADDRADARRMVNRGPRRISPFFVPASIINMISGHVSIKYGFKGPNIASSPPAPPACTPSARRHA
jgi:3-oxoacyl-[acyl-carrier-protein] synthase II